MSDSISSLLSSIRSFADERNWEQFHSPKNLTMALIVEAGELVEHFQWMSEQESCALSPSQREEVALEMADVFIYLCRLSDRLDIDLLAAAKKKMQLNEEKYPVERARNSCKKYTAWKEQE